jgi:hypothetical protein
MCKTRHIFCKITDRENVPKYMNLATSIIFITLNNMSSSDGLFTAICKLVNLIRSFNYTNLTNR